MLQVELNYAPLTFKVPSGTSRGVLTEKHTWYVTLKSTSSPIQGVGEVSIIPGLTPEFNDLTSYQGWLNTCIAELNQSQLSEDLFDSYIQQWANKPSLFFGLEMAFLDYQNGGTCHFFDSSFAQSKTGIPINGLIWMGDENYMLSQIEQKLESGYSCIKMKIGAINFQTELKILASIRKRYSSDQVILRVDANGAFKPSEALEKLHQLANLDIHSIEQPIQAGQWQDMAMLCDKTPCPIALDEELIGVYDLQEKKTLLNTIKPQYIILKPSLHGGFQGCREWIDLANTKHIPWWITSALESNVGLNAIAQFTATYNPHIHQGLGTGGLYINNTPAHSEIREGFLWLLEK